MATIINNFTGKATLEDLDRACENIQDTQKAKLVHMQGAIDPAAAESERYFNQAQFAVVERWSQVYDDLTFIEVDNAARIPTIISERLADNEYLIFDEILIVQGSKKRVLGFGKFE